MNSILVTGSSGFIGSKVIEKLDKSQIITDSNKSKRIDLKNANEVLNIDYADTVIHLGGKIPSKELQWKDYFNNNVSGTFNILEYCIKKKVKKLIYISSYVYGNPKYSPIDENHPINPHNAYSSSKFYGEQLCKHYSDKSDLSVIILRPFNIFGESMNEGFLLTNLINSLKTGQKNTIINKNSKRDFLHIDDFVDLILKIKDYDCKFEIFNVGSEISLSFEDIIKKIEYLTSKKLNLKYLEDEEIFISDIRADISKIKDQLNWEPKIKFEEGLKKMLNIY
jgi:UDP-glucose 4-epimerase